MHEYFQNFWMTGKYVFRMGIHIQNLCTKTVDISTLSLQHYISLIFLNYKMTFISFES